MFVHDRVDPLGSRHPSAFLQGFQIFLARKGPLGFRLQEGILAKVGHFFLFVLLVKGDDFLEGFDGRLRPQPCQISIEVGF